MGKGFGKTIECFSFEGGMGFKMIKIQKEDFDLKTEIETLTSNTQSIGGICSFIGLVRDMAQNKKISAMTLEQYSGMTEKIIKKIEKEALNRWPLHAIVIIHRYGRLLPGDQIVLVATASAHRSAAFDACHFLIDFLKTKAPFWKLEESADTAAWVDARNTDDLAMEKWAIDK